MTNINCSENCIYQKDGKCSFENISEQKVTSHTDCAYFVPKENDYHTINNSIQNSK